MDWYLPQVLLSHIICTSLHMWTRYVMISLACAVRRGHHLPISGQHKYPTSANKYNKKTIEINNNYLCPWAHTSVFPSSEPFHSAEAKACESITSLRIVLLEWKFSKTCSSLESVPLGTAARDVMASCNASILLDRGCKILSAPPSATCEYFFHICRYLPYLI